MRAARTTIHSRAESPTPSHLAAGKRHSVGPAFRRQRNAPNCGISRAGAVRVAAAGPISGCANRAAASAAKAIAVLITSARGEPDDGSLYYHCWLATLERLIVAKGLSQSAELHRCKKTASRTHFLP